MLTWVGGGMDNAVVGYVECSRIAGSGFARKSTTYSSTFLSSVSHHKLRQGKSLTLEQHTGQLKPGVVNPAPTLQQLDFIFYGSWGQLNNISSQECQHELANKCVPGMTAQQSCQKEEVKEKNTCKRGEFWVLQQCRQYFFCLTCFDMFFKVTFLKEILLEYIRKYQNTLEYI